MLLAGIQQLLFDGVAIPKLFCELILFSAHPKTALSLSKKLQILS
jgi:hypothetical protein